LGGSSARRVFLRVLKAYGYGGRLIFLADSDGEKDKEYKQLTEKVRAMGITCDFVRGEDVLGRAKDCNEALQVNRETFRRSVSQWIK